MNAGSAPEGDPFRELDADAARDLIASGEGWVIVDVRTPTEFAAGHPAGAYNIPIALPGPMGPVPNPEFLAVVRRHFGPERRIVFSCAVGNRSRTACRIMAAEGYRDLVNLSGGFTGTFDPARGAFVPGWAARGHPVGVDAPEERTYAGLRGSG